MAAGLGFKTFTTGEVLTANDTNGYLMQGVLVFASSAARASAVTSPQEGQYSFLKDTDSTEYYDGAAWIAAPIGDITGVTAGTGISGGGTSGTVTVTNSMATAITTKGDLVPGTGSGTFTRLAVGNNGETLVADSSTSTGLRYQSNFAAGKNAIINGAFNVWQRGTSISLTNGVEVYTADRFAAKCSFTAGTSTVTQQTFTPGTAPVAGYESQYFARLTCGSTSTYGYFTQKIEDVRTFAGNTITISLWAKASAAVTLSVTPVQNFGSGGSSPVNGSTGTATLTTSWVRYSFTQTLASISGKTVGTNSFVQIYAEFSNNMNAATIDIWGVQVEASNTATAFQTATGTLQGELAACQRYYYRTKATESYSDFGSGYNPTTVVGSFMVPFPVTMRTAPTALEQTGTATDYNILHSSGGAAARTVCNGVPTFSVSTPTMARVQFPVASGLTSGQGAVGGSNNNTTAYLGWSAEL